MEFFVSCAFEPILNHPLVPPVHRGSLPLTTPGPERRYAEKTSYKRGLVDFLANSDRLKAVTAVGSGMIRIAKVASLTSEDLQPYRTLRRAADHVKQGIFVAEGEKVVRRLLETDLQVISLLVTESWLEELTPLLERRQEEIKVWLASKSLLESIVGFQLHKGVMALGRIPRPLALIEILETLQRPYLLVALDGLTNADNVGVIVRNCVAFAAGALIVPRNTSSPYLRRSVRMSMGAVFQLPVAHVEKLPETLRELAARYATRIIAAHPHQAATRIDDSDLTGDVCIVFGSEGAGISEEVLQTCSERATIPIAPGTDSLNVASASAIFLFEAQRQRKAAVDRSAACGSSG